MFPTTKVRFPDKSFVKKNSSENKKKREDDVSGDPFDSGGSQFSPCSDNCQDGCVCSSLNDKIMVVPLELLVKDPSVLLWFKEGSRKIKFPKRTLGSSDEN